MPEPANPSPRLGVCSWSLRPANPEELAAKVRACGLRAVQLALEPLREARAWEPGQTAAILAAAGISIASGMMACRGEDYSTLESIRRTGGLRPDQHWEANLAAARDNAAIARGLGLTLVTLHAGFLPEDPADPERGVMIDRLRRVADIFGEAGISVGLETGQETAETLAAFLDELNHPGVGVNFDPANMVLYGKGDPIEALARLAPRVVQVHIKDALPTQTPGTWGREVPAGTGAVDWEAFFRVLGSLPRRVGLMIEREAGEDRTADIVAARHLVERHIGSEGGAAGHA